MARSRLNALEILKLLPRTNCRKCGVPTCLSFASLVAQAQRPLEACPFLGDDVRAAARQWVEEEGWSQDAVQERAFEGADPLRRRVRELDFARLAPVLGARLVGQRSPGVGQRSPLADGSGTAGSEVSGSGGGGSRGASARDPEPKPGLEPEGGDLEFLCLGRVFRLSRSGRLVSQCHANLWVLLPLLDHVVHVADALQAGMAPDRLVPRGEWIKVQQVRGFVSRSGYFEHRCEHALGRLFEQDVELVQDLLELFGGRAVDAGFDAAVQMRIQPLPRVPLLVCHWPAEAPFPSKTGVYCDRATDYLLGREALTVLGIGIVEMLKRFVARAQFREAPPSPTLPAR